MTPKYYRAVMERRVYRGSRAARISAWVVVSFLFLIGVVVATGSPSDPGKGGTIVAVLGVAAGVIAVLCSLWLGALLAADGLTVTSDGLINRRNLHRRPIGWHEVESFTVGPGRGRMRYPTLFVCLKDGSKVMTSVTSFTVGYPSLAAHELTSLQASAEPSEVVRQDDELLQLLYGFKSRPAGRAACGGTWL